MTTAAADHTFSFLLRSTIPLVLAPPGRLPPVDARIRGVVRADPTHARVVLSADIDLSTGLAVDFDLTPDAEALNVATAVEHARFTVAPGISELLARHQQRPRDSHSNIVVPAVETGFDNIAGSSYPAQDLFGLFSVLVHGGGFPWFEDLYTFAGFMLTHPDVCRIYLRVTNSGVTYGIDLPLAMTDGRSGSGFSNLAQELAALVGDGTLATRKMLDNTDDYCTAVVDLSAWLG